MKRCRVSAGFVWPDNIALVDILLCRKCIFSMSSLGDFLLLWRRGKVEITTSSVSPEIKRSLSSTVIYPMSQSSARERTHIHVCVHAYACVCGNGNRWSDAAKILGTIPKRFLRPPIFTAKNDYTAGGEISAITLRSLHLSSFLIIVYRDLEIYCRK